MKTRSAKAKGKRLEQWVRNIIFSYFPSLTPDDVRITVGSETGSDIKLSKTARDQLPFSIECKNRETFTTLYSYMDQAAANCEEGDLPMVVIKMNNKLPLAIIDANYLFSILRKQN